MLDTARCVYCETPVYLDDEIFWVVNQDEATDQREWRYAHSECGLAHSAGERARPQTSHGVR
jgi:hypothetical protein